MLITAYVYLLLRVIGLLPNTGAYFALIMVVLTTINLVREWREYHHGA